MTKQNGSKSALEDRLEFLEGLAAYLEHQNKEEEKRQVNVRLRLGEIELLDALADHYDQSRTSMAQELLSASIHDALTIAGINAEDVITKAAREKGRLA